MALTWGPPPPSPERPGTFAFAALGDAPYNPYETLQYRVLLRDMAAHRLAWVLHVGDTLGGSCADGELERVARRFASSPHPVVYTPGDNEWTDCWLRGSGRFAPLERLARLRQVYFTPPRALGRGSLPVESQGAGGRSEFVENLRWSHQGYLFATVHLVGSANALKRFPARTAADDEEVTRRTQAAASWMRETFAAATASGAAGVVIAFHANPGWGQEPAHDARRPFEPFVTALQAEAARFARPVLAIQGNDHEYVVDQPLRDGAGRPLANLTRLQVPGSPQVGWVLVTVTPGAAVPFAFERRVVPRWKYW